MRSNRKYFRLRAHHYHSLNSCVAQKCQLYYNGFTNQKCSLLYFIICFGKCLYSAYSFLRKEYQQWFNMFCNIVKTNGQYFMEFTPFFFTIALIICMISHTNSNMLKHQVTCQKVITAVSPPSIPLLTCLGQNLIQWIQEPMEIQPHSPLSACLPLFHCPSLLSTDFVQLSGQSY